MDFLHSRRGRFRLVLAAIVAVATLLVYLGVHYSSPGNSGAATGPEVPNPRLPKNAPFTAEEQRAVRPVLKKFIENAVARRDVSQSWDVAGPSLREGLTRKDWRRGNIPVVPYPAADRGLGTWSYVEYSYTDSVGLEVFLFPQPGSGYAAMTADVRLVRGRDGRWLVDYWLPKRFHGPPALTKESKQKAAEEAKKAQAKGKATGNGGRLRSAEPAIEPRRASRLWWAVPIGFVSLILVLPIAIPLVMWYRRRRAERELLGA